MFQTHSNYQFPQEVVFYFGESETLYILMVTPNKTAAKANLKENTTVESLRERQKTFQNCSGGFRKVLWELIPLDFIFEIWRTQQPRD